MKIANYEKMQLGDLVQVPRTQFAPMRRGWNGWLFSDAVVLRKTRGKKSNRPSVTFTLNYHKAAVVNKSVKYGSGEYGIIEYSSPFIKLFV